MGDMQRMRSWPSVPMMIGDDSDGDDSGGGDGYQTNKPVSMSNNAACKCVLSFDVFSMEQVLKTPVDNGSRAAVAAAEAGSSSGSSRGRQQQWQAAAAVAGSSSSSSSSGSQRVPAKLSGSRLCAEGRHILGRVHHGPDHVIPNTNTLLGDLSADLACQDLLGVLPGQLVLVEGERGEVVAIVVFSEIFIALLVRILAFHRSRAR